MSKFAAFMAQNVEKIENKKIVVSKRFKDENGNPIEWEIRAITSDENEDIQRRATVRTPVVGQRGAYTSDMDKIRYGHLLAAASVVYPELDDAELQDSYGVKTPDALLKKMLYPAEFAELLSQISDFSDIETLSDMVEEAKN